MVRISNSLDSAAIRDLYTPEHCTKQPSPKIPALRCAVRASPAGNADVEKVGLRNYSREMIGERRKIFFVYITASKPRGVLYIGMTSDLPKRTMEHRDRLIDGFAKKYWAGRLVYYERHETAEAAAKRERLMKRWRRDWKIELVENANPTWRDLHNDVLLEFGYEPQ